MYYDCIVHKLFIYLFSEEGKGHVPGGGGRRRKEEEKGFQEGEEEQCILYKFVFFLELIIFKIWFFYVPIFNVFPSSPFTLANILRFFSFPQGSAY